MEIGIRELKARLSEFVERAASGETISVTDRGRPKAVLGPLPGQGRVEQGIAEGWIRPGDGSAPAAVRRVRGRMTILDALAEDRGE